MLFGIDYKSYSLGTKLGEGGEGAVYSIVGEPGLVAKIYTSSRLGTRRDRLTLERKLKTMIDMRIEKVIDGHLRLAWPVDVLYNSGEMVGFVMPRINSSTKIFSVYRGGKASLRQKLHPNCNWKYMVQYSYNLAWIVNYLHKKGIVIGDLNQNNIVVDPKTGIVILIDCDSFDITDKRSGEHFPCSVGLPEILAPELQHVGDLRRGKFTAQSDNFSLAIHIFRLLMNNEDPFGGVAVGGASSSGIWENREIINGECPYVRKINGIEIPKRSLKLDFLPSELRELFEKTFSYNAKTALRQVCKRATAEEWMKALYIFGVRGKNPRLKTCRNNPNHIYPSHNRTCPWCRITPHLSSGDPFPYTYTYGTAPSERSGRAMKKRRSLWGIFITLILTGVLGGVLSILCANAVFSFTFTEMIKVPEYIFAGLYYIFAGIVIGTYIAFVSKEKYRKTRRPVGFLALMAFITLAVSLALFFGVYGIDLLIGG